MWRAIKTTAVSISASTIKNVMNPRIIEYFMSLSIMKIIMMNNFLIIQYCALLFIFSMFKIKMCLTYQSNPFSMATTLKIKLQAILAWSSKMS